MKALRRFSKNKILYAMLLPGFIYFAVFKYAPMWGVLMAFQDYKPHLGFWRSPWVGLKHFYRFFGEPEFWQLFTNTVVLGVYNIVFFFPLPILFALLLNEVRKAALKRLVQTLLYVPHFVSWVVVVGIYYVLFTTEGGLIHVLIQKLGGQEIQFLMEPGWFRGLVTSQVIWKETGWGTIIFLAALSGVDPALYEASRMDGANRLRQAWHITLPAIRSTIVILLILRLGHFLDSHFSQIFLMLNALNREVGEVYDTYVYTVGLQRGQFSYTTAVNLFKNGVGLILVAAANYLAKKFGEEGVY
ncbi:sugar ABC transporter permease [Paenibacillus sp. WQ 127069]|uniref:Sugar ABC transporter permease n=1 Tax=Paenibacillus baimaensis TaxID=2982185 RepID=A0ABT2U8W2_9BACL|nr:sugar ABC transporter permease [Paenibacillus sp. WQ 127069]MCU6791075.1 sugar ABC transporter permease [Paenibacillus sp. WQ 127069]